MIKATIACAAIGLVSGALGYQLADARCEFKLLSAEIAHMNDALRQTTANLRASVVRTSDLANEQRAKVEEIDRLLKNRHD